MFSYQPLITSNEGGDVRHGGNIFHFGIEKPPGYEWRPHYDLFDLKLDYIVDSMHSDVFNRETLRLMEARITNRERAEIKQFTGEDVTDLHEVLDYTQTNVGSATLLRSIVDPPTDLEYSVAKQNSVRELEANDNLRNSIEEYLGEIQKYEKAMFFFLHGGIRGKVPDNTYSRFGAARRMGEKIVKAAENIPTPETPYLSSLVQEIKKYGETNIYQMMRGPIWRAWGGVKSSEEVHPLEPRMRYIPFRLTAISILPAVAAAYAIQNLEGPVQDLVKLCSIFTIFAPLAKTGFDNSVFIRPLMRKALANDDFLTAVDAYGKLDELVSFVKYAKEVPHTTTLAELTNNPTHEFRARGIKNPILAMEMKDFVPNDLDLEGLTFITGPNSGGKTTICKTIMQSQVMAQIGMPIVAEYAKIGMMLYGAYQAPMFDSLRDPEGRFGTEHKLTREIFFAMKSQGLGIFDELSEGTTFDEKMKASKKVMDGFRAIGNNTILVTHNHELVNQYQKEGIGQFLQVEFDGTRPTHRLVPGISTKSHAAIVEERIGFSQDDIDTHIRDLRRRGEIPKEMIF